MEATLGAAPSDSPYPELPPPLAELWPAVSAALPQEWRQPPADATAITKRVWRVTLEGGRMLALKIAGELAPLDVEAQALTYLAQRSCPVPKVLAAGAGRPVPWLALSWCGGSTLDDVAQTAPPDAAEWIGESLAESVAAVEAAFEPFTIQVRRSASDWSAGVTTLHELTTSWAETAPAAFEWVLRRPLLGAAGLIRETLEVAMDEDPTVASLDYNASNVIVAQPGERPVLLDFASVGLDWAERRLVQYGTATGRADGTFVSVITESAVRHYAALTAGRLGQSPTHLIERVDAHDVLILAAAATQLEAVAAGLAHPDRIASWRDISRRRLALLHLLRRPLARSGPAADLRHLVRIS